MTLTEKLTMRCTKPERDQIEREAAKKEWSVSKYLRKLLLRAGRVSS